MSYDPLTGLPVIVTSAVDRLREAMRSLRFHQIGGENCISWADFLDFVEKRLAED